MGQNQQFALVVMTNNDVYYISIEDAKELMRLAGEPAAPAFFLTRDVKNHTVISISFGNVSSVVIKEGN